MKFQNAVISCARCGGSTDIKIPVEVEMGAFSRALKKVTCAVCGAGYKYLRMVHTMPQLEPTP